MSPIRIEIKRLGVPLRGSPTSTDQTTIIENPKGFTVGPALAANILNLPRTTLFYHDPCGVKRARGRRGGERVYDDRTLLAIAQRTNRVNVEENLLGDPVVLSYYNENASKSVVTHLKIEPEAD